MLDSSKRYLCVMKNIFIAWSKHFIFIIVYNYIIIIIIIIIIIKSVLVSDPTLDRVDFRCNFNWPDMSDNNNVKPRFNSTSELRVKIKNDL